MSWGPNLAVLLAGAALLGGMMATAPGYDSTIRPFAIHAAPGEWADGRVFDARFLGGQLTREIGFQRYGQDIIRDSNGVFLIADFEVSGALLHKSADGRGSPFPGQTYPTASVTGVPSAV